MKESWILIRGSEFALLDRDVSQCATRESREPAKKLSPASFDATLR